MRAPGADTISLLYIVAFALFSYGLSGLTGPKTAVRGNLTAAAGMDLAIVAALLRPGTGHWWLIGVGLAIGTLVGVPAPRRVKMTAMPQMVALSWPRSPPTSAGRSLRSVRPGTWSGSTRSKG